MDNLKSIIIAVDGPSGSGKSSVSKMIAERLKLTYIDTGAMYRAVTLKVMNEGANIEDTSRVGAIASRCNITFKKVDNENHTFLDSEDVSDQIRESKVTRLTSKVSSIPIVREVLVSLQRQIGKNGGVIMDGRDVGTVIFPDAQCKFFLDASLDVRGKRRYLEIQEKNGLAVDEDSVVKDMAARDEADSTRSDSPLTKADDAIYIDTTDMSPLDVVKAMEKVISSTVNQE
ncbi:MAG: (d)CMP kinase [Proteobacteria bacterium]|nr:(d)CMP kinase [Pseudomonadota bacterium]